MAVPVSRVSTVPALDATEWTEFTVAESTIRLPAPAWPEPRRWKPTIPAWLVRWWFLVYAWFRTLTRRPLPTQRAIGTVYVPQIVERIPLVATFPQGIARVDYDGHGNAYKFLLGDGTSHTVTAQERAKWRRESLKRWKAGAA